MKESLLGFVDTLGEVDLVGHHVIKLVKIDELVRLVSHSEKVLLLEHGKVHEAWVPKLSLHTVRCLVAAVRGSGLKHVKVLVDTHERRSGALREVVDEARDRLHD